MALQCTNSFPTVFFLSLITAILSRGLCNSSSDSSAWSWVPHLKEMNGTEFKQQIYPILELAANAYRYPKLKSINGWKPATLVSPLASPEGGCHALAYVPDNDTSSAIIVSFRGTQVTDQIDGQADLCADMILWNGLDFESLPSYCKVFDEETLDYLSQGISFSRKVMKAYPEGDLLFTGHSLGAGLAVLVSAAISANGGPVFPVLGFGPPGTQELLKKRNLRFRAAEEGLAVLVANEWDEIVRSHWKEQVGTLCLYPVGEPECCSACFSSRKWKRDEVIPTGSCGECFMETHYLAALMRLAEKAIKPRCQERIPHLVLADVAR
eukprot:TRINITY_DN1459_c0_g1_i2.p1 TRINITY_DN1459_c0_g1~~TRINITY_DN1459_c0_g1_i2.p1  ORF type:complete len:324 (-),score=19.73 TRINITY_DN1459_c0_g1_i2:58-1029(-)